MIDHVSLGVSDLKASAAFYGAVLEPLGLALMIRRPGSVGFGRKYPEFWLNERRAMARVAAESGSHVCLRAADRAAVIAFHAAALAHGGSDEGAPGDRSATMTPYFAAFVGDLDGNRIEAATFPRKPAD